MQRPTSSARASPNHHVIDIGEWSSPKRREACGRWSLWRSPEKHWILAVLVIVIVILWWYSHPVNLGSKDSLRGIRGIYNLEPLKDTRDVDLIILALASPPKASIPHIPTLKNKVDVILELKAVSP